MNIDEIVNYIKKSPNRHLLTFELISKLFNLSKVGSENFLITNPKKISLNDLTNSYFTQLGAELLSDLITYHDISKPVGVIVYWGNYISE